MRRNIREKMWWPCMDRDVTNAVQECAGCAAVSKEYPPEPMIRKEMPERAWQEIAIDFFSERMFYVFSHRRLLQSILEGDRDEEY